MDDPAPRRREDPERGGCRGLVVGIQGQVLVPDPVPGSGGRIRRWCRHLEPWQVPAGGHRVRALSLRGPSSCVVFDLSPAAGAVVRADLVQHGGQRRERDGCVAVEGDGAGGLVGVSAGDDVVGVRDDQAVVEEQVDVVLGGEEGAHVAVEREVRLNAAFDGLFDVGFGFVDEIAQLTADVALPVREGAEVGVDSRVARVVTHCSTRQSRNCCRRGPAR